jgi:hypothetical protein
MATTVDGEHIINLGQGFTIFLCTGGPLPPELRKPMGTKRETRMRIILGYLICGRRTAFGG